MDLFSIKAIKEKLNVNLCSYKLYLSGCKKEGQHSYFIYVWSSYSYNFIHQILPGIGSVIKETEYEVDTEEDDDWNDSKLINEE